MPLFISDDDVVELKVFHTEKDGILKFYMKEPMPAEVEENMFIFRRPNWGDQNAIMETTLRIDLTSGTPIMDPYKYIDAKLKVLLKSWSLKDNKGEPLKISSENIDKLDPNLIEYLNVKLNELLFLNVPRELSENVSARLSEQGEDQAE
jgi:hypothetical protein